MQDNGNGPKDDRLPPPAFPPGSDRARAARASTPADLEDDGSIPDDAIFSPDDPIERSGTRLPDDAFFSPDEPIVRAAPPTKPEDFEEVLGSLKSARVASDGDEATEADDVVVTGIGLDTHLRGRGSSRFDDPHVERLYARLVGLVKSVKEKGEAGLRTTPEMSRFDATLRGYCVGYLAGLRENPDHEE